jgi:hypothetical protein
MYGHQEKKYLAGLINFIYTKSTTAQWREIESWITILNKQQFYTKKYAIA